MRYIATGKVHPERSDIRFTPIEWRIPGEGSVVVHCDGSQITVVIDLAGIDGWATAYQQAKHFGHMAIGTLGLALGVAVSLELVQVITENGQPYVFGAEAIGRVPGQTLRVEPPDVAFNRAIQVGNQDVHFRLAIGDYLRAIDDAVDCAMHCARAIDTLRASLQARGEADADVMLGLGDGAFAKTIAPYATPVRAGHWANSPSTDNDSRWAMLGLTRDALLKYLDQQPAPAA